MYSRMRIHSARLTAKLTLLPLVASLLVASEAYTDSSGNEKRYELKHWQQLFTPASIEQCGDRSPLECFMDDVAVINKRFVKDRCGKTGWPYAIEIRDRRPIGADSAELLRSQGIDVIELKNTDGTVTYYASPRAFVLCTVQEHDDAVARGILRDYGWVFSFMREAQP